ncbi:MAG: hypothetical protein K1X47_14070, partial [Cyclobacteriaceae bacterium]|nr:hypothetical protein [Cyclobacteriaceae bacterium]
MKTAARVLSWVYQPLLMPTYLFVVILAYNPSLLLPLRPVWSLVFLITGMTFGLPAINFAFFRMTGSVRNLTMPDRRDRIGPFIFISGLYVFLTLLFYFKMHMLSLVY